MNFKAGQKVKISDHTGDYYIYNDCNVDEGGFIQVIATYSEDWYPRSRYERFVYYKDCVEVVDNGEEFYSRFYRNGDVVIVSEDNFEFGGQIVVIKSEHPEINCGDVYYCVTDIYGRFRAILCESDLIGRLEDHPGYSAPEYFETRTCNHCGSLFKVSDELCIEDSYMCETCRDRKFVTAYHRNIPRLSFKGESKDGLYYGLEIELDGGGERDSNATRLMSYFNNYNTKDMYCYCSHDGSLNDGFEMITMPATYDYHKSLEGQYEKAFKDMVSLGYRGHDTTTAGIHVHFSREYYEDNEEENVMKLLFLVEKFWDEIIIFSRRDYNKSKGYMKKIDDDYESFIDCWNKKQFHDGHYYAVNITNEDTIELRMFRSTLNVNTLMATLDFVDKLVRAAKEMSSYDLQRIEFEDLLTPRALEYYRQRVAMKKFEET